MEVKVSWQFDFNDFAKFLTDLSCVSFVLFLKNEQVLCTQNLPLFDFQSGFIFFCAKKIFLDEAMKQIVSWVKNSWLEAKKWVEFGIDKMRLPKFVSMYFLDLIFM